MGMGFGGSVVCPVIIGRETQLDALKQRVEQARAGRGQTLLLTGEAGIGKTRLAEASKALAHANGFQVLEGHCFEPDRGLPYAPLLDLLHSYPPAKSSSRIANGLPSPGEFIKLLHELDPRLPKPNRSPALEPEQEKRRLFQTLTQFIAHLSESQPLQVVIEDLHWCDDTSLDFLIFLTRQLSSLRVLLLLTYRSEETHPALIHFLAELDRKHLAAELLLTPLTFAEVDAMIRMIFSLDRPVRPSFSSRFTRSPRGIPFSSKRH